MVLNCTIGFIPSVPDEADGYLARLLEFVTGPMQADVVYTSPTLFNFGKEMGALVSSLRRFAFPHPTTGRPSVTPQARLPHTVDGHGDRVDDGTDELDFPPFIWDLQQSAMVADKLAAIKSDDTRAMVAQALRDFHAVVVPAYASCSRGFIHGDLNDRNVIMTATEGVQFGAA